MAKEYIEIQAPITYIESREVGVTGRDGNRGKTNVTSIILKLGDGFRVECSAWGDLGQRGAERLGVGDVVRVEGKLSDIHCFEKGNGERGHSLKIRASGIHKVKEELEVV